MLARLTKLLDLFKARLSRNIVLWIFASIVIIEAIILIPSVNKREQELLAQLKEISSGKVTWIIMAYPGASAQEILAQVEKLQLKPILHNILGADIYDSQGQLLGSFGEKPELSFAQVNSDGIITLQSRNGSRYDIAWSGKLLPKNCTLIIRHDVSSIKRELYAYTGRIAGLVILISAFVTFVTILVLGKTVIVPVLRLRDDLMAAGEALSKDQANLDSYNFYAFSVKRTDELGEVMEAFNQMFKRVSWETKERMQAEAILRVEQEKSDRLLLNILPEPIAKQLKEGKACIADGFSEVTIMFADIVGFTELSQRISPRELVELLNVLFSAFDHLSEQYGLEKIKTIGDAYMIASGLPIPRSDHAQAIAEMALDMQEEIAKFNGEQNTALSIRIGINTGSVVAGVIGKKKFIYDLWGDAVNTASRMESHGIPGRIQVSESTYEILKSQYLFEERGSIEVKGKGEMTTYLLTGRR
ncbi:MAG: adenylate/guanylate cyclase domain-containing protein [Moorea sp. SIO2B7]|nr:adenylate/guanylate cyclase domain-containing protein [Moorena sp. SIO2B7]